MSKFKPDINTIRRIKNYYHNAILAAKIFLVAFLLVFCYTDFFSQARKNLQSVLINYSAGKDITLQNLIIAGKTNLPLEAILSALNADTGTPLFAIDLGKMQTNLEQNSWVKNVIVQRRLPDTIYVGIEEREPIAIWQYNKNLFLIDENAKIIKTSKLDKFEHLPHVVGYGANKNAKNLITELQKYPELARHIVSAVRYGDRRWNLILEQDIIVKMPEQHDFAYAYKQLNEMYINRDLLDQNYNYIDLRSKAKYFYDKKAK